MRAMDYAPTRVDPGELGPGRETDVVMDYGGSVPLPLLVAGVLADDAHDAATADDFALVADLLDAGSHLHRSGSSAVVAGRCHRGGGAQGELLVPIGDPPPGRIVG